MAASQAVHAFATGILCHLALRLHIPAVSSAVCTARPLKTAIPVSSHAALLCAIDVVLTDK